MQKILVIAGLAILSGLVVWKVVDLMTSEETRIWWTIEDAATDFGTKDRADLVGAFTPDWRNATSGTDRPALDRALLWMFQEPAFQKDGLFQFRADPDATTYEVTVDGDRATATGELTVEKRNAGQGWDAVWRLRFELELEKVEDDWRIARSRHETLDGAQPF